MRIANVLMGAAVMAAAVGCGGAPEGQGDDQAAEQVESPLEATGKLEFYAEIEEKSQAFFKGESPTAAKQQHPNYIPAFRFHMGVEAPFNPATGAGTGKRQHEPIKITKAFGASDPQILTAFDNSETLKNVTLHFVRPEKTGASVEFQTITMEDCQFISVERATLQLDDAAKSEIFADEITIQWRKLTLEDKDGKTQYEYTNQP
jgi:type VI secretion system Hcp family effector